MARHPETYDKVIGAEIKEERSSVCPKCCTLYPLDETGYPGMLECISQTAEHSKRCGEILCKKRRGKRQPRMVLRRRKLDDWIQKLLSRPGMMSKIDRAWETARNPPRNPMSDFWDGSFVREFKGPDGNPAAEFGQNETRLLFSLSVDWFNPYYN